MYVNAQRPVLNRNLPAGNEPRTVAVPTAIFKMITGLGRVGNTEI